MKNKYVEHIKTGVIVILTVSAFFLAYKTGLFNEFIDDILSKDNISDVGDNAQSSADGEDGEISEEARPVSMAVVGASGMRCGEENDRSQMDLMYKKLSNIFGEALGSAASPQICSEEEWRQALVKPGAYFSYSTEIPLQMMVKWFGTSMINNIGYSASRFIIICGENDEVELYYMSGTDICRCTTEAKAENLRQLTEEFLPNGAYFAFEEPEKCADIEAYTLIIPNMSDSYVISESNISGNDELRGRAAEAFGISILDGASYPENSGTVAYVGGEGILKIKTNAIMTYKASEKDDDSLHDNSVDDISMIEQAFTLINKIRNGYGGDERLYFSGIKEDGDIVTVSFNYYVNETEIMQQSGSAADISYKDGCLYSAQIYLRSYRLSQDVQLLLPKLQAAAIAGSTGKNKYPKLIYFDEGNDTIEPKWIVE